MASSSSTTAMKTIREQSASSVAATKKMTVLSAAQSASNPRSLFSKLPSSVIDKNFSPFLDIKTQAILAQTCKRLTPFVVVNLTSLRTQLLAPILQAVVYGNMDEAKRLIKAKPTLLYSRGTVIAYSGHTIEQTALQIAVGAKDISRPEHPDEGMSDMIEGILRTLPGGEQEIKRQYTEQLSFSEEEKNEEKATVLRDSSEIERVYGAIGSATLDDAQKTLDLDDRIQKEIVDQKDTELQSKHENLLKAKTPLLFETAFNELKATAVTKKLISATFNFDLLKALYRFRNYMERKKDTIIRKGYHFNEQFQIELYNFYDSNYERFAKGFHGDLCKSPKNLIAWRKVVGYGQRFYPACLGQAEAQGFYFLVEDRKPLSRTFKYKYGAAVIFPLDSNPRCRLGYHFAGDMLFHRFAGREAGVERRHVENGSWSPGLFFKIFVEQKNRLAIAKKQAAEASEVPMRDAASSCSIM